MSPPVDPERGSQLNDNQDAAMTISEDGVEVEQSRNKWTKKLESLHTKIPGLKRLPFNAVAIIAGLILFQFAAWAIAGLVLYSHPELIGTAAIAWSLGLRHALDADHISCIDLMTRRLIAAGQRPVTVGTFFSLGHSTIVIITCIAVAATSSAAAKHFDNFSYIGGIIGSSVSASFLVLLGIMNMYILVKLVRQLRALMQTPPGQEPEFQLFEGAGCLYNIIKRLFKIVDRPWKMFPVGVMFGLGFDTSSEVALLGISALQASKGTSLWFILIFPFLFTSGMCLVDTTDGALMMSLYTSAAGSRDPFIVTYYSLILTGITVVVALFIGTLQALELADAVIPNPTGPFWDGVGKLGDAYDIIGACICGSFAFFGILSVICYRPWRRWVEKRRTRRFLGYGTMDQEETMEDLVMNVNDSSKSQQPHIQVTKDGQESVVIKDGPSL